MLKSCEQGIGSSLKLWYFLQRGGDFRPHSEKSKDYFRFCALGSLQEVLCGIELRLVVCKPSALTPLLFLCPTSEAVKWKEGVFVRFPRRKQH